MKTLRFILGVLFAAALSLSYAAAQTVTGSITGQVTDPSGAVVVGAKVTAENVATAVKTSAVTNSAGVYTIRFLPIGTYNVTVDATGFAPNTIGPFALEIDQTAKIDAALKIGTSSTVEVKESFHPILNTTDATLGNTLSTNEIQNVPLNGRNFSSLTLFQPGAIDTDPTGMTGNNAIERNTYNNGVAAVNGNRQQENNYTIEGADNNEPQNNLIGYNPAPDAIAELRVVAANANATYGNANGGAVVTILKSGTNHFHGSAYDLLESQIFDSNSWGNDHNYPIIPKNSYTQQIFGATFGGPIVKNKLFFFGDYEGVRKHNGGTSSASLLTPQMLQGNFSALTAKGTQLYDTQNGFAAYANNQVPVVNPVAKFLAANPSLYPAPNATPTDGLIASNYQGKTSSFISNNQGDVKIDWTPGSVNQINGFYSQGTGKDFTSAIVPVFFPAENTYPTKIFGASFVRTFSPTVVNEFRFGFTRVRWNNGIPTDPSGVFGLNGNQKVGIPFGKQLFDGFSGQSINTASYIGANANVQVFTDNTFNYYDNLTWQRGRHLFTMGGQATRYQQNYVNAGNVGFLGQFSYSGIFSSNSSASDGPGYGPADFVLDRIANDQLASPTGWVGNRQWRLAGYFQDDFKLSPRLTLNLGIRYEYDQPWYEQNNKTANVLPGGTVEYAGHVPTGAVAGSIVCPTRACYNANYNQVMPRLGFAYQMNPRFVLRGGYGATSFFEGYSFNQRLTSSPPFSLAINTNAPPPSKTAGGVPFTVEEGFGGQQYGINPNYNLYSAWPQNVQPAYIHQFNLTSEYAITNELSFSVGYHGQDGHHLADYRDANQIPIQNAAAASAIINASGSSNCNVPFPAALQTPYYALLGECSPLLLTESSARMNYNAGQVTVRQRTHKGLEYTLNYTWAKSLTNSSGNYAVANTSWNGSSVQDAYNLNGDYGPSGMDIRHSMNFVGVYELPFGRGRAYGGGANRFLDSAFGGWKLAASALLYSGFPVTIFGQGNNGTQNAFGFNRANQYRPMIIHNQSINNWWGTDPSVTPCQAAGVDNGVCAYGQEGNFQFGTAHNSSERGPGYRQVDASLFKDFHLFGESHVLGFRADFFNLFNIASYGNPDNSISDGKNFGLISGVRSPVRQIQLSLHYAF
ncbi:MAG: carboxypeptidase regulatory-like domain-containing protein [Candidatus Sulfotelmatobacter sp.]